MNSATAQNLIQKKSALHKSLRAWFRREARDLPWRKSRTPYRVWISEIMLQQTTVTTVIAYYERWLRELPTIQALANCPEERVLKLWEGLGYYSRARNLRRAAEQIVSRHGGRFPRDFEDVLALPGVGRYTAGAICSISLGQRVPLVDGNVARVFARWLGARADIKSPSTLKSLWQFAQDILPEKNCGAWNEALMELGALICTPTQPKCPVCPVRANCSARAKGLENKIPTSRKTTLIAREETALVIVSGQNVWLEKIDQGAKFKGFWRFPLVEPAQFARAKVLATIPYTFTKYRVTLRFIKPARMPRDLLHPSWHRIPSSKLSTLPMPVAHRKFAEHLKSSPPCLPSLLGNSPALLFSQAKDSHEPH
ncbi:A/G-specific adenine glycosylase [Kamptonema cortianum]|nr:A/G-specific adenine glycosylase [Kamptonema cortianum]